MRITDEQLDARYWNKRLRYKRLQNNLPRKYTILLDAVLDILLLDRVIPPVLHLPGVQLRH